MKPLFRKEALVAQQSGLYGEALRMGFPRLRLLTLAAVSLAAAIVAFAFCGEYTRKEHVTGYLSPTKGLIKIYTPQAGTVQERRVGEGQAVRQGDVLLVISSERASASAAATHAAVLEELRLRRDSLKQEQAKQLRIDALAAGGLATRIRSLEAEMAQARTQIELQRSRAANAQRTLARHEQLVAARFVAEAVLQQKHDEVLDQRNQLAALERTLTGLARDLASARTELASAGPRGENHAAALARQVSELEQQLADGDARRTVVLTAPADGTVTTVLADLGQAASPGVPLLAILPAGAQLEAHLLVPTRAAGFIRPEQSVALRYQAFPYQRFGHHAGVVAEVGRTVLQPNEAALPVAIREPVYRVTVRLGEQQIRAYGQNLLLQAGMALDADVHIDRRRLIEWLIDPVLAVARRV